MVQTHRAEVLANTLDGAIEGLADAAAQLRAILHGPEIQQLGHAGSEADVGERSARAGEVSGAHIVVGDERHVAQAQVLAEPLVIGEDEGFVFHDGAAERGSELIAAEAGHRLPVEKVSGVQIAIAEKFEQRSMQSVGSRLRGDGHLGAGALAVFGAVGSGGDVKFAHRVHAQQLAAGTAGLKIDFRRGRVFDAVQ